MNDVLIAVLATIGSLAVLIAAIGLVRMPDFYLRLSVTVKAATLGIGMLLTGAALFFTETSVTMKVLAIILFILLTAPVSAQMIGRAAYFIGIRMWKGYVIDELKGKYDKNTHQLNSDDQPSVTTKRAKNGGKEDNHNEDVQDNSKFDTDAS